MEAEQVLNLGLMTDGFKKQPKTCELTNIAQARSLEVKHARQDLKDIT